MKFLAYTTSPLLVISTLLGRVQAQQEPVATVFSFTLLAADMDGDGRQDVIIGTTVGFAIAYNDDNGSGQPSFTYQYISGSNGGQKRPGRSGRMAVADLDGDGDLDVVTGTNLDFRATANVYFHRNLGGRATFESTALNTKEFYQDDDVDGISVVDVDGDGDMDIFVTIKTEVGRRTFHCFLNDGQGNFEKMTITNDLGSGGMHVGDFNNDGKPDAASYMTYPKESGGMMKVFLNRFDQSASFEEIHINHTSTNVVPIGVADVNDDGYDDMLGTTGLFLFDGGLGTSPSFEYLDFEQNAKGYSGTLVLDFDNDGGTSIVSLATQSGVLYRSIILGTKGRAVASGELFDFGRKVARYGLGDFDGDGALDVVAQTWGGSSYNRLVWVSGIHFAPPATLSPTEAPTLPQPTSSPTVSLSPTVGGICTGGSVTEDCSNYYRSSTCSACTGVCSYYLDDCKAACGARPGCSCRLKTGVCILGSGDNTISCSGTTTVDCADLTTAKSCASQPGCTWKPNEIKSAESTDIEPNGGDEHAYSPTTPPNQNSSSLEGRGPKDIKSESPNIEQNGAGGDDTTSPPNQNSSSLAEMGLQDIMKLKFVAAFSLAAGMLLVAL